MIEDNQNLPRRVFSVLCCIIPSGILLGPVRGKYHGWYWQSMYRVFLYERGYAKKMKVNALVFLTPAHIE